MSAPPGPVVFAYDGGELAGYAIERAGELLSTDRQALILTVWQPFDVGFVPTGGLQFDAAQVPAVKAAAEKTAAEGAARAQAAGFQVDSEATEATPTWKGIVEAAEERDASLIVLGSHSRGAVGHVLIGSVAASVASHSARSVLIIHRRPK
jgi:nucleotide-binding universal stress UspA family protein